MRKVKESIQKLIEDHSEEDNKETINRLLAKSKE